MTLWWLALHSLLLRFSHVSELATQSSSTAQKEPLTTRAYYLLFQEGLKNTKTRIALLDLKSASLHLFYHLRSSTRIQNRDCFSKRDKEYIFQQFYLGLLFSTDNSDNSASFIFIFTYLLKRNVISVVLSKCEVVSAFLRFDINKMCLQLYNL